MLTAQDIWITFADHYLAELVGSFIAFDVEPRDDHRAMDVRRFLMLIA